MADATMPGDLGGGDYGLDLNPDFLGGLNEGLQGAHPEKASGVRTAYDIKGLHHRLNNINDNDLKGIPVLPLGTPLEQGATYLDLREEHPVEFTAMGGMEAGSENWYVPKTEVQYVVWNILIGVKNPERLDQADEGATDQPKRARASNRSDASASTGTGSRSRSTARSKSASAESGSASAGSSSRQGQDSLADEVGAASGNQSFTPTPEGIPESESGASLRPHTQGDVPY